MKFEKNSAVWILKVVQLHTLQVRKIVSPLSKDKEGRIKIDDFLLQDIHSEDAFKVNM